MGSGHHTGILPHQAASGHPGDGSQPARAQTLVLTFTPYQVSIRACMLLQTVIPNCLLRPWSPGDKAALVRHANNRKVWRNLTDLFPHPYTEADANAWLAVAGKPGASMHLAIELDGEAIGGIGIIAGRDVSRYTGQFGYWLGEAHWGKGIATAAGRAVLAHAFAHTDLVRLEAPVFAWNPASMRVLEKIGFQRECVRRRSVFKDGQLIDSVMYTAIRET